MILVLLAAGVVTGVAAAIGVLLAGQGIGLALLAYALGGALGLVAGAVILMLRDPAVVRPARDRAAAGGRPAFAPPALGEQQA